MQRLSTHLRGTIDTFQVSTMWNATIFLPTILNIQRNTRKTTKESKKLKASKKSEHFVTSEESNDEANEQVNKKFKISNEEGVV